MKRTRIKTVKSREADYMLSELFESICNLFGMHPGEMTVFLLFASVMYFLIEILIVFPIVYVKNRGTIEKDWEDLKYVAGVSSAKELYSKAIHFPFASKILKLSYAERIKKDDAGMARGNIKNIPILAGRARKRKT